MDQELLGRLRTLLHTAIEEEVDVAADENLFNVGILDSMVLIRLVELVEQEFKISVADREMSPDYFLSLERMSLFMRKKLTETQATRSEPCP